MDDPMAQSDVPASTMAPPILSGFNKIIGGTNNAAGGILPSMGAKSAIGHVSGRSADRRGQGFNPGLRFDMPVPSGAAFNMMQQPMWVAPGRGGLLHGGGEWQPDASLFPSAAKRKRRPLGDDMNPAPTKLKPLAKDFEVASSASVASSVAVTTGTSFNCMDNTFDGGFALFGDSAQEASSNQLDQEAPRWDLSNVLNFGEDFRLTAPPTPGGFASKLPLLSSASSGAGGGGRVLRVDEPIALKPPRPNAFDAVGLLADSLLSTGGPSASEFAAGCNDAPSELGCFAQGDANQILSDLTTCHGLSMDIKQQVSDAVHDPLRKIKDVPFVIAPPADDFAGPIVALQTPPVPRRRGLKPDPSSKSDDGSLGSSISTTSSATDAPQTPKSSGRQRSPSHRNLSNSRYLKKRDSGNGTEEPYASRPELNEQSLAELNDISCFRNDEKHAKSVVEYHEGISFPLGEGGRELLRACLNVKGCKGRQLQGASVPSLLALAHHWRLWDVAIRIKVERANGQLCPQHEAFVRFKATQSQMRKYVKKEYMVTERDNSGKISKIVYDETRKITLGKEGREALRAQLRRLHDKHAHKMDELLERHGFKYSELRNATVQQLSRMAFVCNLWDQVVHACRKQEEKKDGKGQLRDHPLLPQHFARAIASGQTIMNLGDAAAQSLTDGNACCKQEIVEEEQDPEAGYRSAAGNEQSLFNADPLAHLQQPVPQQPASSLVKTELGCESSSAQTEEAYMQQGLMPSQQEESGGPEVSIEDFIKYAPAFLPSSAQEAIAELFRGNVGDKAAQDEDSVFQAIMDMVPFTDRDSEKQSADENCHLDPNNVENSNHDDILSTPMFASSNDKAREW